MKCPSCLTEVREGQSRCPVCGSPVYSLPAKKKSNAMSEKRSAAAKGASGKKPAAKSASGKKPAAKKSTSGSRSASKSGSAGKRAPAKKSASSGKKATAAAASKSKQPDGKLTHAGKAAMGPPSLPPGLILGCLFAMAVIGLAACVIAMRLIA